MVKEDKEEKRSEKYVSVRRRILQMISELSPISKRTPAQKGSGMYAYYAHEDVQEAVMKLLPKYGVFLNSVPYLVDIGGIQRLRMVVRFEDAEDQEDYYETETTVTMGRLEGEKACGSAMSYALKYTLMRTFGLGGEDDPDSFANQTKEVNEEPKKIKKHQADILNGFFEELKDDKTGFVKRLLEYYKVDKAEDILEKDYPDAVKNINKYLMNLKKEIMNKPL